MIAYSKREESLGAAAIASSSVASCSQVLDRRWRDHLYEMDYLKDGIGLRAMAQRDPLIEYQREGYQMFQAMMGQIKEESVGYLYNLEVEVRRADGEARWPRSRPRVSAAAPVEGQRLQYSAANDAGEVEVRNDRGQVQQAATSRMRQAAATAAAATAAPRHPVSRFSLPHALPRPREAPSVSGRKRPPRPPRHRSNRAQRRAAEKKK